MDDLESQNQNLEAPLLPAPHPEKNVDDLKDNDMFFPCYREQVRDGEYTAVKLFCRYFFLFWVCFFIMNIIRFKVKIDYKVTKVMYITDQYWAILCEASF